MAASRVCPKCAERKGAEFFPKKGTNCRKCLAAYMRDWYAKKHGKVPERLRVNLPDRHREVDAAEHDSAMLAHGESIVRQCPRAHHAVDVITSGWWAMNKETA
ncbi:MAG: hypothetical protein ABI972_31080 [Acidobacteriota bacterium]